MCYNVLQCANGERNQDGARGGQSVEHCHTDTTTLLHWEICYILRILKQIVDLVSLTSTQDILRVR